MIERPSLHALAVFLAVADHGTMTAAAEAEGIAQPAISSHVRNLERYYGVTLLERGGRRVRLTPAGEALVAHSRRLLGLVDEMGQVIADIKGLRAGRLVVGASATVAETWLPPVLGQFRRIHPEIELEVRLGNSERVLQGVRDRSLGFGIIGRPAEAPYLTVSPIFEDRLLLFTAAGSRAPNTAALRLADLLGEPFVLREHGSATREAVLGRFRLLGVMPETVVTLGSNEAVKRSVAAGLGIGILSAQTLDVDARAGDIEILPCVDWECRRTFWLVHRTDHLLSHAEQAFVKMLQRPGARKAKTPGE